MYDPLIMFAHAVMLMGRRINDLSNEVERLTMGTTEEGWSPAAYDLMKLRSTLWEIIHMAEQVLKDAKDD
jgi:hypothetical protein